MNKFLLTTIRWLSCCLIFFMPGCESRNNSYNTFTPTQQDSIHDLERTRRGMASIGSLEHKIQSGDLITRTGNDFTSESLRKLNQRDQTYSHCGIASIEHDSVFVYHAIGGDFNPDQKIKRDPLLLFSDPFNNKGIAVFRFETTDSMKIKIVSTARKLFDDGMMFDMDFNLQTDDRMYCAEYVFKCFSRASSGRLVFNHSHINDFEFIGVDDLFLHPLSKAIAQLVYK